LSSEQQQRNELTEYEIVADPECQNVVAILSTECQAHRLKILRTFTLFVAAVIRRKLQT